jgi:hypothetical protein
MDPIDQPSINPVSVSVAPSEAALAPANPPNHRWLWFLLGLIIIIGLGVWWFAFRDTSMRASTGFADRTTLPVSGLNTVVETKGTCTKSYELQAAGRAADGTQHYALVITLTGDPKDQTELFTVLNDSVCNTELVAINTAVAPLVGAETNPKILTPTYRSKSGQLLFLP